MLAPHYKLPNLMPIITIVSIVILISFSSLFWFTQNYTHKALYNVILDIRLPRYIGTLCIGASLAICGCLLQNMTHNLLAEPSILGVSSTSSLFSLIFLMLNFQPTIGGILGAILAIMILHLNKKNYTSNHILLNGLMLNTLSGACITLCLQLAEKQQLPQLLFWLMGDLNYITWQNLPYISLNLLLLILTINHYKHQLNYLWLDKTKAYTLGINLGKLKQKLFIILGISIGIITSQVGGISFIGLACPYIATYFIKLNKINNSINNQLIYSAIIGAFMLSLADIIAKYILYPGQISIGIITAFIGVPILWKILHAINTKS